MIEMLFNGLITPFVTRVISDKLDVTRTQCIKAEDDQVIKLSKLTSL